MKATPTILEVMATLNNTENPGINEIMNLIDATKDKIFSNYPIFDDNYRDVLNSKILAHYMNYQIGYESIGYFLFAINRKMGEIMPYYNQLYEIALQVANVDFAENMDYYEELEQESNRKGNTEEEGDGSRQNNTNNIYESLEHLKEDDSQGGSNKTTHEFNEQTVSDNTNGGNRNGYNKREPDLDTWDYYSDTPQGNINGVTDKTYLTNLNHSNNSGVENTDYDENYSGTVTINDDHTGMNTDTLTIDTDNHKEYNKNVNNSNVSDFREQTLTNNRKEERWNDTMGYVKHVYGINNAGSVIDQITKIKDAIMNVDMMVINALETCFFGLW